MRISAASGLWAAATAGRRGPRGSRHGRRRSAGQRCPAWEPRRPARWSPAPRRLPLNAPVAFATSRRASSTRLGRAERAGRRRRTTTARIERRVVGGPARTPPSSTCHSAAVSRLEVGQPMLGLHGDRGGRGLRGHARTAVRRRLHPRTAPTGTCARDARPGARLMRRADLAGRHRRRRHRATPPDPHAATRAPTGYPARLCGGRHAAASVRAYGVDGAFQLWLAPPLQSQMTSRVPSAVFHPGTSRQRLEATLRSVWPS